MLIDGVRIRWGVERVPGQAWGNVVLTFSVQDAMERFSIPHADGNPVAAVVIDAVDVLVNSGVLKADSRPIVIGLSRDLFENWGYRWSDKA